jgi:hypothetical protein
MLLTVDPHSLVTSPEGPLTSCRAVGGGNRFVGQILFRFWLASSSSRERDRLKPMRKIVRCGDQCAPCILLINVQRLSFPFCLYAVVTPKVVNTTCKLDGTMRRTFCGLPFHQLSVSAAVGGSSAALKQRSRSLSRGPLRSRHHQRAHSDHPN